MRVELENLEVGLEKTGTVVWANEAPASLAETVLWFAKHRNAFEAMECEVLAAFDSSQENKADGATSAAAWVAHRTHARVETVAGRVNVAKRLWSMPHVAAAFLAGEISLDHVRVLVKANTPSLTAKFCLDEERLVGYARDLSYPGFVLKVRNWRDIANPDDAERRALAAWEARELHLSETFEGMGRGDAWFDPISYHELKAEMDRRVEVLLEQDWADARARLGDLATVDDLGRTAAQRRHDAMIEMARRSRRLDGPVAEPDLGTTVVTDHDTYVAALARLAAEMNGDDPNDIEYPMERRCEFADGTPVTPEQMLAISLAGWTNSLVLDENGFPLKYTRSRRCFQGPQRSAAMIAFPECEEPGCDIRSVHCQIDHILEWILGGYTDSDNAKPLCRAHNLWKERLRKRGIGRQTSP